MNVDKPRRSRRALPFWLGISSALALLAIGGAAALMVVPRYRPAAVERSLELYVEGLSSAGKLVLVEGRERLSIRETTPGQLFGNGALGNLLGIRSDATVIVSAWADLSFAIDLNAPEGWSARYLGSGGGRIELAAPPLAMLTPAVLTDTVEVTVADRSIFLDESRLVESARRGLTARFVEAASAMLDDPGLRLRAAESLEGIARAFARESGVKLASVGVSFAPAED